MPDSPDNNPPDTTELPASFDRRATTRTRPYTFLDTPAPVKQLFSHFPIRRYPAESRSASSLPPPPPSTRAPSLQIELWVPSLESKHDARWPVFDLESLKWQTYALAQGIDFTLRKAQPDSAPDGKLPFLIATPPPQQQQQQQSRSTVGGGGKKATRSSPTLVRRAELKTFIRARARKLRPNQILSDEKIADSQESERLGISLLEQEIRPAWLWSLYMTPANFDSIVREHYINPVTSSTLARKMLEWQIKAEAKKDLAGWVSAAQFEASKEDSEANKDVASALNRRVEKALYALETLLCQSSFFSKGGRPGLLDAELFAYTHLLTQSVHETGDWWVDDRLVKLFESRSLIMQHHKEVFEYCYGQAF